MHWPYGLCHLLLVISPASSGVDTRESSEDKLFTPGYQYKEHGIGREEVQHRKHTSSPPILCYFVHQHSNYRFFAHQLSKTTTDFIKYDDQNSNMHTKSTLFIISSLLANGMMASPFAAPESDDLVVTYIEPAHTGGGGSLIYYGDSAGATERRSVDNDDNSEDFENFSEFEKRAWWGPAQPKECKTDEHPECDDENGGSNDICADLVDNLVANSAQRIPEGTRQICEKNDDGKTACCIKWTRVIPELTKGDLHTHAEKSKRLFPSITCSLLLPFCSCLGTNFC